MAIVPGFVRWWREQATKRAWITVVDLIFVGVFFGILGGAGIVDDSGGNNGRPIDPPEHRPEACNAREFFACLSECSKDYICTP